MSDKHIPMAPAELLTVAPENTANQDSYGTAAPKKVKKNHTGLIVILCLLCVLLATVLAVIALARLRLKISGGKLLLLPEQVAETQDDTPKEQELQPNTDAQPQTQPDTDYDRRLEFGSSQPQADLGMSVQELYTTVSPGVVCVCAEGYYGSTVGTGVILDDSGYLLTAQQTVAGSSQITVTLQNGQIGEAELVGYDTTTGLALLHCDLEGLTPATFGSAEDLLVGDRLYCIGNPYGSQLRNVLSEGILTVCSDVSIEDNTFTVLQTDASFGADCTGCPVFDQAGNLVAVTCPIGAWLTDSTEADLAISAADVQRIAQSIVTEATAEDHCWLGFSVEEIPETYLYYYAFPGSLWITEVGTGTYADGALSVYDVILSVNGVSVSTVEEYNLALEQCEVGDLVELRIYRGGFYYRISLPLTEK